MQRDYQVEISALDLNNKARFAIATRPDISRIRVNRSVAQTEAMA